VAARSEALPDVPTVGEFVPGFEVSQWYGVGVSKNTPADIIGRLNKEINAGLADPRLKARFADWAGRCLLARRFRKADRRRNREMGQGGEVFGRQA
jgi:hypothetical protein